MVKRLINFSVIIDIEVDFISTYNSIRLFSIFINHISKLIMFFFLFYKTLLDFCSGQDF